MTTTIKILVYCFQSKISKGSEFTQSKFDHIYFTRLFFTFLFLHLLQVSLHNTTRSRSSLSPRTVVNSPSLKMKNQMRRKTVSNKKKKMKLANKKTKKKTKKKVCYQFSVNDIRHGNDFRTSATQTSSTPLKMSLKMTSDWQMIANSAILNYQVLYIDSHGQ